MRHSEWLWVRDAADARTFLTALAILVVVLPSLSRPLSFHLYAFAPAEAVDRYDRIRIMHRLVTDFAADPPDVLVVGGSQMRELLPDDGLVADQLARRCGSPVTVFNASTSSQAPSSSYALLDHFDERPPALTLIAANPYRFHRPAAREGDAARSALPVPGEPISSRLAAFWTDAGLIGEYGGRRPTIPGDPFHARQHHYHREVWADERKRSDAEREVELALPGDDPRVDANVTAAIEAARRTIARRGSVVFVIPPHSTQANVPYEAYTDSMAVIVARLRDVAPVLDLRSHPALAEHHFRDAVHLGTAGRRAIWPDLRDAMMGALPGCAR